MTQVLRKDNVPSGLGAVDPHSKTGSNSQPMRGSHLGVTSSLDHITILWLKAGSTSIHGSMTNMLGITFDLSNPIGRRIGVWWDRCWSSVDGCLLSERDSADGQVHCRLSISGTACRRQTNMRLRGFMIWCNLNLFGLSCSRIDIAVDDFSKQLQLIELQGACERGDYAGFRKCKSTINWGSKHNGWTVNLGSREGEKYIRIYDKFAESNGEIDSIRFEAELSGDISNSLFKLILEFPQNETEYQQELINYAVGTVSFLEKNDRNLSRNLLLKWWDDWLNYLKSCPKKVKVIRKKSSIQDKKDWIKRAVSKSMCLVKDALGEIKMAEFVCEILIDAKLKYTNFDLMLLSDYRMINAC